MAKVKEKAKKKAKPKGRPVGLVIPVAHFDQIAGIAARQNVAWSLVMRAAIAEGLDTAEGRIEQVKDLL